ncbi:hypothetical protein FH972_023953 [Carpinus fangiana]|uniref:Pre-mRNA processing factor 4 (PRP4)-like domain-containing protein n=1 Tax=Carpinus fangiana TaxID=176857 RepID=A0A5N6KZ51_9ROSI|nr:hypothetical protein FH972_023953 [Carpinus fangiana]
MDPSRGSTPETPFATDVAPEKANAILSQFDRKRRAAGLIVPTDDIQVRFRLRELKEPVTIFGEGKAERRDRLRHLLLKKQDQNGDLDPDGDVHLSDASDDDDDGNDKDNKDEEEFYTEGTDELLNSRKDMARYSLGRAQHRINFQKVESTIPLRTHVKHRTEIKQRLKGIDLFASQVAADRPVSITRFAPNGEIVAAGNWGGTIKLLDVPNLEEKKVYRGHNDRVGGISWFPGSTLPDQGVSPDSVNLASGGGEGNVQLWSLNSETPLSTLSGHSNRVCRVEFHPSGKYLASASYDTTWRLWDVNTSTEILLQEGHSREVYTVSFNGDGSLLASGGLDSLGRIWDLRTGRTIMLLEGHVKDIYGLDWSPDGYRVLTGSGDGLAICWDVRMVRELARIPANSRGVTDLKWFKGTDGPASMKMPARDDQGEVVPKKSGTFFVSCGFDKNVTVFSANDWAPCRTLSGHSANVLSTDVTNDGRWIVSSGHDRTVKLWARDDMEGI